MTDLDLDAIEKRASAQAAAYERMLELDGGIGLLAVHHPEMGDAMREWMDATENEHADTVLALLAEVRRLRALLSEEVEVEGSIFRREDLPEVLGNFMRSSDEYAREAKELMVTLTELRSVREEDTRALSSLPDEETACGHQRDRDGICSRCGQGLTALDVVDGER